MHYGAVKQMVKDNNLIMLKFKMMEIVLFMMVVENLYGLVIHGIKVLLLLNLLCKVMLI